MAEIEEFRFDDLREVLSKAEDSPALVLLGAPGSGKSTLLRRLQLDHSIDRLRDNVEEVSFFVQLNGYRAHGNGDLPEPLEWLTARWSERYPTLPELENYLKAGRVLLLLDALNEMPHKSPADYHRLVGLWKEYTQSACSQGTG
ncbi:MAG: NACHT domain-containing protein [Acidobacteria bacterium]|nr:NACHT domain-containing protein [Acidobacteriota bacterium]